MTRRVVVTGIGGVSGYGIGVESLWRGLVGGKTAVRPVDWRGWESAPIQVAAQVPEPVSRRRCRNPSPERDGGVCKWPDWLCRRPWAGIGRREPEDLPRPSAGRAPASKKVATRWRFWRRSFP
ncbi:MAG: hypothetical protein EBT50_05950 [Verrucomicrobia bacterium]|nr:hypothetical protein [Verrucomicrobiota bacterium]